MFCVTDIYNKHACVALLKDKKVVVVSEKCQNQR